MRSSSVALTVAVILATCCPDWSASADESAPLEAGWAITDITPPLGFRLSGYFRERRATGIKDPLHAKALVLRQGEMQVALVFCDLVWVPHEISVRARRQSAARTGLSIDRISILATHTHTGPLYYGAMRDLLHRQAVDASGTDPGEPIDYVPFLIERIVAAVDQANNRLRPVGLKAAKLRQRPQISFNRRYHMKDGSVRFNPGVGNPNIIRPAGPIDPYVDVLLFTDPGTDRPLASLTVFALHLDTTGGTEYSADYPYYLEKHLKAELGEAFVSFFASGTCGDINHIDVRARDGARRRAPELGRLLSRTVLRAIAQARPLDPSLKLAHTTLYARAQQYSDEQKQWAEETLPLIVTRKLPFLERVRAYKIADLARFPNGRIPLEIHAVRLSRETAAVTLPGEVFVELGLELKRRSPFPHTIVMELANGAPAYIPTRKAFREGSYEIVNSRIAPGEGERMIDEAVGLLKQLAP